MKRLFHRLLALGLGLMLALGAIEVLLRFVDPFGFRVRGDRIVLPVFRKYTIQDHGFPKLDPVIHHTKNSLGFRGPEPPSDWTNTLTIFTVGGSTTEGFYVSDGKDWPTLLGKQLATRFDPFWLNNAGLNGHSTFGHLLLVEDYLVKWKPKVIVFLVGANDVGRTDMREHDARFVTKGWGARSWKDALKSLATHSRVIDLALNLQRYFAAVQLGVVERKEVDPRAQGVLHETPADVAERMDAEDEAALPGYRDRLIRLIALCRANGIEPVFVTQPALVGFGKDPATGVDLATIRVHEENGAFGWRRMEKYNDVLRDLGRERGVCVVDLAARMPKDSTYYYDWGHFTNVGEERVARIVAEALAPWLAQHYPDKRVENEEGTTDFTDDTDS